MRFYIGSMLIVVPLTVLTTMNSRSKRVKKSNVFLLLGQQALCWPNVFGKSASGESLINTKNK